MAIDITELFFVFYFGITVVVSVSVSVFCLGICNASCDDDVADGLPTEGCVVVVG
jgi:hypothetical protein